MCFFADTGLTVTVTIDYTPPVDFDRPSESDYRAGSGPAVFRCQAVGGTGPVNYMWSSTCNSCFIIGLTATIITRDFLSVNDGGTHTCTATDSGGATGNTSTVMNVIGMLVVFSTL